MSFDKYFSGGAALLGMFLSWFLGSMDGLMKLLVVLAVIDQLSGVMKGFILKRWSSEIGFHGISKKVMMFVFVGLANIIDNELLGKSELLRDAVCFFYVANEGLSIIENSIEIGVPVPDSLKEKFMAWQTKQLTSKNEPEPDDE